jgi:hypothetical protein
MGEQPILFLHGFASSTRGTKAHYFREQLAKQPHVTYHAVDFNPTPTDFTHMTTTGLINRLRQYVLDHDLQTVAIIGSSFGGLVATHYAHRYAGVERMLLLAPLLRWRSGDMTTEQLHTWEQTGTIPVMHAAFDRELPIRFDLEADGVRYTEPAPPAADTLIIHGSQDESVPVADSQQYAADFAERVQLLKVDAGHDLNEHLALIWSHVQSFLLEP